MVISTLLFLGFLEVVVGQPPLQVRLGFVSSQNVCVCGVSVERILKNACPKDSLTAVAWLTFTDPSQAPGISFKVQEIIPDDPIAFPSPEALGQTTAG